MSGKMGHNGFSAVGSLFSDRLLVLGGLVIVALALAGLVTVFSTDRDNVLIDSGTWDKAIDTVRNCNRVAGDPENPDVVAFMGYEWTHVGSIAEQHYGHHNVLYRDTDEAGLPPRPVSAIRYWQGTNERIVPKKLPAALGRVD